MHKPLVAPIRAYPRISRRNVLAIGTGLVVFVLIIVLGTLDAFYGPLAVALAVLLFVGFPTAKNLSRRLSINGIVILGFGPLLWWAPWASDWAVTHTSLLIGLSAAYLAAWVVWREARVRSVVPSVGAGDIATLGTAAFLAWFFRPFYTYTSGLDSVSLLQQAFAGDNVAHFNMFRMIRVMGTTGPNWPATPDGTLFAYEPYPQHYHALVAQVAELWAGAGIGTVDVEAGLFIAGSATVLSLGVVTLVASAASLGQLRRRLGLSLVVASGAISFLLLGFGSYALSYGFPPYLLAITGTLIALVFAIKPGRSNVVALLGSAAATVLVAHTWSLLAPLAGIGLLWCLARLPWRSRARRGRLIAIAGGVSALVSAAGGWAFYLVVSATAPVGSFATVLGIPGASPAASIPLTVGLAVALVGVVLLLQQRQGWPVRSWWLIALVACVGVLQAGLLIALQASRDGVISYFQLKFVNALFVIFAILLVLMIVILIAEWRPRKLSNERPIGSTANIAIAIAVVVVVSGLPVSLHPVLASSTSPGISFRTLTAIAAQTHLERTTRLIAASEVMATQPCIRPIYLGAMVDDLTLDVSNQWAMSLSSTWTEASSPINSYLFSQNSEDDLGAAPEIALYLLTETPNSCLVVAPDVKTYLTQKLDPSFADRVLTW
jgi:hypothetical protein